MDVVEVLGVGRRSLEKKKLTVYILLSMVGSGSPKRWDR